MLKFLEALKAMLDAEESRVGFILLDVLIQLIDEFDYRKSTGPLHREVKDMLDMTDLADAIQALLLALIMYASGLAARRESEIEEYLEAMKAAAWELGYANASRAAYETWQMPAYLPEIGRRLAIVWVCDCGGRKPKKPKAFFSKLRWLVVEMSTDIYEMLGGCIMRWGRGEL